MASSTFFELWGLEIASSISLDITSSTSFGITSSTSFEIASFTSLEIVLSSSFEVWGLEFSIFEVWDSFSFSFSFSSFEVWGLEVALSSSFEVWGLEIVLTSSFDWDSSIFSIDSLFSITTFSLLSDLDSNWHYI